MSGKDDPPPWDEPRTVFSPNWRPPQPPSFERPDPFPPPAPPPPRTPTGDIFGATLSAAPSAAPRQVRVGDVLNHLYQVRRFIARGGMGEVFEGVNINQDDERVAIKVILPHLAADPNVLAMFRKEARTLTRLSHPALVQYRTIAQEPALGVLYIVTEYIDGPNLSGLLRRLEPTAQQVRDLIRRLAEGLRVAHALGAIHRDIAPDNIMLEGGRLEAAKIIDFGIAKELDAGVNTIIGTGFAGRLNYVAPEQLGDYGRNVGPWTDVYSLALSALALIERRDVQMGATLSEAVDRRRGIPDLSRAPPDLRPVLARMLEPDPARRLRSMDAVVAALGGAAGSGPPPRVGSSAERDAGGPVWATLTASLRARPWLYGGSAAAALLLLATFAVLDGSEREKGAEVPSASSAPGAAPPADPLRTAQSTIDQGLAKLPCSWVDSTEVTSQGVDVAAAFRGVSGEPAQAQKRLEELLKAQGLRAASLDFSNVAQIEQGFCGVVDTLLPIRDPGPPQLNPAQPVFEVDYFKDVDGQTLFGAEAVVELAPTTAGAADGALLGVTADGAIETIGIGRNNIDEILTEFAGRLVVQTTHTGWSGIILLTGQGPFDEAMLRNPAGTLSQAWREKFLAQARARQWKAEIAWYQTVDAQPNKQP